MKAHGATPAVLHLGHCIRLCAGRRHQLCRIRCFYGVNFAVNFALTMAKTLFLFNIESYIGPHFRRLPHRKPRLFKRLAYRAFRLV